MPYIPRRTGTHPRTVTPKFHTPRWQSYMRTHPMSSLRCSSQVRRQRRRVLNVRGKAAVGVQTNPLMMRQAPRAASFLALTVPSHTQQHRLRLISRSEQKLNVHAIAVARAKLGSSVPSIYARQIDHSCRRCDVITDVVCRLSTLPGIGLIGCILSGSAGLPTLQAVWL